MGFQTSGRVTQVNVKIGDQVESGQVLAQLDDTLALMKYGEAQQSLQELHSAVSIATVQQEIATAEDARFAAREWLDDLLSPQVMDAEENLGIAERKRAFAQAQAQIHPSEEANQVVKERENAVAYLRDKLFQARTYSENVYLPETFGKYENVGSRRFPRIVLSANVDPATGEELPEINGPSAVDLAKGWNDYARAKETISEGQVYQQLSTSDTAAQEEITALTEQILETMTSEQMKAVNEMNLTSQDVSRSCRTREFSSAMGRRAEAVISLSGRKMAADPGEVPVVAGRVRASAPNRSQRCRHAAPKMAEVASNSTLLLPLLSRHW